MKSRFLVALILSVTLSNASFAQSGGYHKVNALKASVKAIDQNLKGKVKTVKTISLSNKNVKQSSFNESGFLVSTSDSNPSVVYTYQNDRLVSIRYNYPNRSRLLFYGTSGFLEKEEEEDSIEVGKGKNTQSSYYTYNATFDTLVISYNYNRDMRMYDVVLIDSFYFSFNSKGQISKERNVSVHADKHCYGSTKTYTYDSIGNVIRSTIMADCAYGGNNSCTNWTYIMAYDERGNLIYQRLDDATIRNSLRSDGYTYRALYNEHNDVIDIAYEHQKEGGNGFSIVHADKNKGSLNPNNGFYKYDANGNWVKKFHLDNGHKKLVQKRVIKYYH